MRTLVGNGMRSAQDNPWAAIVQQAFMSLAAGIEGLQIAFIDALTQVQQLVINFTLLRHDLALMYAVNCMGIPDSDIRAVILNHPKHGDHVWLWNHRRIPLPKEYYGD